MTDRQENKLSMYLAVKTTVDAFNASWAGMPAFVTAYGNFTNRVDEIAQTRQMQEKATTGVTDDKEDAKQAAIAKALAVGSAVSAFASVTGNQTLREQVNYSYTDLDECRDTIGYDRLMVIWNAGNDNIGSLADYGVLPADITELGTLITTYQDQIQDPRVAIGDRSAATEHLPEAFAQADDILKNQLDKLMEVLKSTDGEFYVNYRKARIIVDLGKGGATTEPPLPA